ncbi:hypothetical protein BEH94_02855 [Candidatus Altiarchaeales archaeon WOR_SM1_SCG]|nr:hypothetical protein BEH94_02855 [Candidatus Altiarchaeales archaeon WOR_SM1_SCG]
MENKNSKIGRKTDALGNIKSSKNTDERTKNLLNFGFVILIGIVVVGLTVGCIEEKKPEEKPKTIDNYLNEAKTLKEKGNIDAALNVLFEANELYPKTPDVLLGIAEIYKENKTYDKAIDYLEQAKDAAEEKTPRDTTIHYESIKHQKDIARDTNNYNPVIDTYEDIIKITPDDPTAHKELGDMFIETGDTSGALDEFTTAKELNPTSLTSRDAVKFNNDAIAEAEIGNYVVAEDLFKISLLHADDEKTITNYATMLSNWAFDKGQAGNITGMADLATNSIEIKPTGNGHYILGIADAVLENEADAVNNFNDALAIESQCYKCENALGVIDARNGNLESAKIHFEDALAINPGYIAAQDNLNITSQILSEKLDSVNLDAIFNFDILGVKGKIFGEIVWETTAKCMKEAGQILSSANNTEELPHLFKEAASAFQPLDSLLIDHPKNNSHYSRFLELSHLFRSIGELWEEGDMQGVSIQLENAGQIFDDAGGFPEDSELGSSFIEVGKSLHLFSGLTELIANQQEVMTEMEELSEFYRSEGVDSIANMLNNLSISDDPEVEQWIHNGCYVDVPEIDSYTPEMLDSTLMVFFNFFEESPHEFQNWLNETAMETSVLSAQELGMALGNMGDGILLGGITCKDTCSPEGHRKEKVSVKVGLTKGNSQSAFIWLLAHAPKKSPGFGAVGTLIPSAMKNLKKSLKKNVYTKIWVKIEYYECKKTACWAFWDELDWHKIKTVDWTQIKPPAGNIGYECPTKPGAWHGTKNWDDKTKEKIQELIKKEVKDNKPP